MTLKWPGDVPTSEFSQPFAQHMLNAMGMSFFKYGRLAEAYPRKVNALKCLQKRLDLYLKTANTEFLVDVANFAMIEFMHPGLPEAHFDPTDDARMKVGRSWIGDVDPSLRRNEEF